MDFPIKVTVNRDYAINTMNIKKWDEPRTYKIILHDIPDLQAALYELKKLVDEITLGVAIENIQVQSSHDIVVTVVGEVFGILRYGRIWVDTEFKNKIMNNKKAEKKAQKMIDIASVKNDILMAINMLRTQYPEGDTSWSYNEPIVWLYYSLHKQFGDPLPDEILTAQSKLKEKQNDS